MNSMDGQWQAASVRGKRYDTGWGADNKHPGFIPNKTGDVIKGLVFISDDLPAHWNRLDTFEGKDYQRVSIQATLETGECLHVQIYKALSKT